jgi:hypothetical protein
MCTGVTKGLARRKFSGSVKILGVNKIIIINRDNANRKPSTSLVE